MKTIELLILTAAVCGFATYAVYEVGSAAKSQSSMAFQSVGVILGYEERRPADFDAKFVKAPILGVTGK